MNYFYVGIDPGLKGGIVAIDYRGTVLASFVMPVIGNELNIPWFIDIITEFKGFGDKKLVPHIAIESPIAMPKLASGSVLKAGTNFGILIGVIAAYNIKYTVVRPNEWTKVIHKGLPKGLTGKEKSLILFQREYPGLDLRATDRCKNQHDGLIDALLIAEWLRRTNRGDVN